MLDGFDDRGAYAQTIVAYCGGEGEEVIVAARGSTDFGWDAIFECGEGEGEGKTYGEMDKAEKNLVSHRGKAFAKFKEYLNEELD